jgi:predicted acetyltransferase
MALGFLDDRLVSQVCLHKREILVGEEPVRVAGVGGVATHPAFVRRGFASQVLRDCVPWMRDELAVPFGLLLCAEELKSFYARCGWQEVASFLSFMQDEQIRRLETCVMIQTLAGERWPAGKIDLRGLPW